MTKAADIMAAATPGPWWKPTGETDPDTVYGNDGDAVAVVYGNLARGGEASENARAIVTAVNLFPLYEAVREAAGNLIRTDGLDSFTPEADRAIWRVIRALDALQAAEDAL